MRLENEKYLRAHPEVKMLMNHFVRHVLEHEPNDIPTFASGYFSDPGLRQKVNPTRVLDEAVEKE